MSTNVLRSTTHAIRIRTVFRYDPEIPMHLHDPVRHFSGIEALIFIAAVDQEASDGPKGGKVPANYVRSCTVESISYNSPLEIVVGIGAGITTGSYVANKMIAVWTNYQAARKVTANADLYVSAVNVLDEAMTNLEILPDDPLQARWELAARVLLELDSLDIEEN